MEQKIFTKNRIFEVVHDYRSFIFGWLIGTLLLPAVFNRAVSICFVLLLIGERLHEIKFEYLKGGKKIEWKS